MKKVIINNQVYFYNQRLGFYFYDYRGLKQVPFSCIRLTPKKENYEKN